MNIRSLVNFLHKQFKNKQIYTTFLAKERSNLGAMQSALQDGLVYAEIASSLTHDRFVITGADVILSFVEGCAQRPLPANA